MVRAFAWCCLYLGALISLTNSKQYRTDYEYNEQSDAFYKLHIESESLSLAGEMCGIEGASLMLPVTQHDVVQVHRMFKMYPDLENHVWVQNDAQEHESAEEPAIINLSVEPEDEADDMPRWERRGDVMTRQGEVQTMPSYHRLPFVCKVEAREAFYNRECDVYGTDYLRAPNVSSCYKIPQVAYSWNQAYAECQAEGAHLVVVNSETEHAHVQALMQGSKPAVGAKVQWFFYAGFRAQPTTDGSERVFKTIFNQTLEQAGYSTWAEGEPNNHANNENCGTLFKNDGKYNDVDCTHLYAFICEKEIDAV